MASSEDRCRAVSDEAAFGGHEHCSLRSLRLARGIACMSWRDE
jgi:hypothetical protein